ncbi:MAG: cytochrome c3 family protein [Duodenibacillus sp.]|nr:cytochrome c3 family protein [Duodenibacillus sp.]
MNLPNAALAAMLCACLALPAAAADAPRLADRHAAKGVNCLTCHQDPAKGALRMNGKREACVQCHGWYDAVAKKTQPKDPEDMNPHSQHDGNLPCTECHKGHKPGVNYCAGCHMWNFKVP